jgi:GH24 family phage-related lysozyme (muramidase)
MLDMKLGYYGAKLLASFEFPHGIQTRPERDALGIPTIMGMTSLPDGTKVTMDMEFTEADIVELYGERQKEFVDCVNRSVRVEINQHQFDALVCMAYNTGASAFGDEPNNTVLRLTNKGEFENAAPAFGRWVYGTLVGGKPGPDGELARGPDKETMEDGEVWKKAFGGLYRRHVSEALLYCSLDWERAAHPDNIQLTKRSEERAFGFYDIVKFKTPWKKIKDDAKYDALPLDPVELDDKVFEPEGVSGVIAQKTKPQPEIDPIKWKQFESAQAAGYAGEYEDFVRHRLSVKARKGKVIIVPETDGESKLAEDSQTVDGIATRRMGKRQLSIGAVTGTVGTAVATVKGLTENTKEAQDVANDASDLVFSLTLSQMLTMIIILGLAAVAIGGIRWWIGENKAYEGRLKDTVVKV